MSRTPQAAGRLPGDDRERPELRLRWRATAASAPSAAARTIRPSAAAGPASSHLSSFCPVRLEQAIALARRLRPGDRGQRRVGGEDGRGDGQVQSGVAPGFRAPGVVAARDGPQRSLPGRRRPQRGRCARPSAPDDRRACGTAASTASPCCTGWSSFSARASGSFPPPPRRLPEGAIDEFGSLVDQSQRLAEERLENQVAQTIHLARSARECGAAAASAFGAGFGGSVWALIRTGAAEDFLARWGQSYCRDFPAEAGDPASFSAAPGPDSSNSRITAPEKQREDFACSAGKG